MYARPPGSLCWFFIQQKVFSLFFSRKSWDFSLWLTVIPLFVSTESLCLDVSTEQPLTHHPLVQGGDWKQTAPPHTHARSKALKGTDSKWHTFCILNNLWNKIRNIKIHVCTAWYHLGCEMLLLNITKVCRWSNSCHWESENMKMKIMWHFYVGFFLIQWFAQ